jgi:formylglycine-generating enzyme required for sulfatase activity
MRFVVGASAVGVMLLSVFLVWRTFRPEVVEEGELFDEAVLEQSRSAGPNPNMLQGEIPAADLLRRARQAGDAQLALEQLGRIVRDFPQTAAAREARMALDRAEQGLPLFAENPVVAEKVEPTAPLAPAPAPVVTVPAAPAAAVAAQGTAKVVAPAAHAEPYRAAGKIAATPGVTPRALPAGFTARPEAGVHASGWPLEIVGDRDGAPLVLVPAGTFLQGRDDGPAAERPAHSVSLPAYYIDQHEVTVRQYNLYREDKARHSEPVRPLASTSAQSNPDLPAVMITAGRPATSPSGRASSCRPRPSGRWPRGRPTGRPHPWGASPPEWEKPREPRQIDPVLSFPNDLSPFGVYDLAGNAWEWTGDFYDPRYYQQFRERTAENPAGPRASSSRPPN